MLYWDETRFRNTDIINAKLPPHSAETICGFARRVMMQTYSAWKIVGLTIYKGDVPLDTPFSTIPSSTDLCIDVCCALSTLHYDLAPEVKTAVESNTPVRDVALYSKGGIQILELGIIKQFTPSKQYFDTDDLKGFLNVYGIQQPRTLFRVTSDNLSLKVMLYLQKVQGNQDSAKSQLIINHVLDDAVTPTTTFLDDGNNAKVKNILPASTTADFKISCTTAEKPEESFEAVLSTVSGDPRKDEIVERFKSVLHTCVGMYVGRIIG